MAEEKLTVIVKAIELMKYSMKMTSNKKRYPAKYRMLVERIQNKSMNIYEFLLDANRLNIAISRTERLELQTKAITTCDKLSCFIEMSMELGLIGSDTVNVWQTKINNVKYMAIKWREIDKKR